MILTSAYLVLLLGTDAVELQDPTRPPTTQKVDEASSGANAASLRVSAIFIAGERRYAIVNQRIMYVGDKLGDLVVAAIHADAVHFSEHGQTRVVVLNDTKVKDNTDEF